MIALHDIVLNNILNRFTLNTLVFLSAASSTIMSFRGVVFTTNLFNWTWLCISFKLAVPWRKSVPSQLLQVIIETPQHRIFCCFEISRDFVIGAKL